MTASPEPLIFEAISVPHRSLRPLALALLAAMCLGWALIGSVVFLVLGAWPVVPFLGVETLLVLVLVLLHHRWSARAREVVSLGAGRLVVRRTDGRGRLEVAELDPYWSRVEWSEREGLALRQRGRRVAIGRYLSEPEQRDLADALGAALAAYRSPVFDNPQLREPG
ncbi:DUF2244 domain-containing protein [Roseomonas sp. KE0001]|uniref:DUF2244 domain-containing protein n=1 Tax=unclassified Roseomonas TaxID=2617492 RepID=UPI0018DFF9AC|nr:DUF2244 domain-containing protein [Roseomonas sp. KE0001]MBI0434108.1 DUF2244 domain-containing protein [Roseomonas sp. KE0001]